MNDATPNNTVEEAFDKQPPAKVLDLKKHYAVDFLGTGKLVPIRKNKATTAMVQGCKPGVATWRNASIRYYVSDDAELCKKLAPYIDSKLR